MKLHEIMHWISNYISLTSVPRDWLASAIDGTYEVIDGKINVKGYVTIPRDTESFPVQFDKVTGNFDCSHTKITSLKGSPRQVGGSFSCNNTQITSLKGSPSEVGGNFYCHNTQITSLEGCPSQVGSDFICTGTQITSLIGVADNIMQINRTFFVSWKKIESGGLGLVLISRLTGLAGNGSSFGPFEILKKYFGKPDLIFDCQQELIEAGFAEYAQL